MPWAGSGGRKVAQNRPKWLLGHENGPAKSEAGLVASLKCGPEAGRGAGGGGGIGCFSHSPLQDLRCYESMKKAQSRQKDYYLRLLEDYQWCELGVNVFSESYK